MKLTRFEFIIGTLSLLCPWPLSWGGNRIYRGYKIETINDFLRAIPLRPEQPQMAFGPLWRRPWLYAHPAIQDAPILMKAMIDRVLAENRALTVTEWNALFMKKIPGF
jgi:hypothetical protein